MLTLDQIKLLEAKVEKAIGVINKLNEERNALKIKLAEKNKRISELENLIVSFKDDHSKIEDGVLNALDLLSVFEDSLNPVKPQPVEKTEPEKMTKKQKDLAEILGKTNESKNDAEEQMDIF